MKARVICVLQCDTQARAAQVRDALLASLVGKSLFLSDVQAVADDPPLCVANVMFNLEAEAIAWRDQVALTWTTGSLAGRIARAFATLHRCPHDDPAAEQYNCHADPRAAYTRQEK